MRCRRCHSVRLFKLDIIHPKDNPVVRCRECGFLFSPGLPAPTPPDSVSGGGDAPPGVPPDVPPGTHIARGG